MGILDRIFTRKIEEQPVVETPISLKNGIEAILLVLENLSLMNKEVIRERISDKDAYDDRILEELPIHQPENLNYLEKYYGNVKFGYGSNRIQEIREKLNSYVTEKLIIGQTDDKILEELIMIVESDIVNYENIIIHFNDSLRQVEEKTTDYTDRTKMIEEWKTYYKEQELGYPIPLDNKLEEMMKALRELPYNGYGEVEIKKFVEASKKIMEEARMNNENSLHTYNRILAELFNPMKNRYLADVENLKRKMQMIEESPYISDFEKEQNKQTLITEFNKMNGHQSETNTSLEQMKKNLTTLEYGGYGEEVINQFTRRAETMISDGKRIQKPTEEVRKDIQADYDRLINNYQAKLAMMKEQVESVNKMTISEKEKDKMKALIVEDFHDEMGLPIDYKDRINAMILELQNLDRGGYGELKIKEFKTKALERLEGTTNRVEVRDALKEIREVEERMIREYQEELRKLYDAMERASHDRHLTAEEKQKTIEEFDREFKFKMGYRMNFNKYIENRAEELKNLSGGGYGKEAIDEFIEEAKIIAESAEEEKQKYDKIHVKFIALKKQYYTNLRTFKEWKRIQLEHASDSEELEAALNHKIGYMLSLSPKALQDYYLEDDRKKKEETDKHNYVAAFKFLAKQEAKHQRNESIYEIRMKELKEGQEPYTKDEIEEATAELKVLSLSSEELQEDERLISLVDYIDSTLLRQMMYIEASLMKDSH